MLNDSIVNFYLNYCLNQTIEDELQLNAITQEEALGLIHDNFQGTNERKEMVFKAMDKILLKTYIFSTFFFPLLKGLRKLDNQDIKAKVIKWAFDGHIFEREFILFPIFQHAHFSLALFCYPNKFKEYVKKKEIVNGIDYSRSQKSNKMDDSGRPSKRGKFVKMNNLNNQ